MYGLLMKLMAFIGKSALRSLEKMTKDPRKVQEELLLTILEENKDTEYGRKDGLRYHGQLPAAKTDPSADQNGRDGKQRFPQIHIETGYAVMESELEDIAKRKAHDQDQRRGIGPEDGDIRQPQKPGDQKTMVLAKHFLREAGCSSRSRVTECQTMIVDGEYHHRRRSQKHSDHRAERSRARQESGSRHDECAPADRIAESERNRTQRRYKTLAPFK